MLSFSEQLQQIRQRQREDPIVNSVPDWLRKDRHRFVSVEAKDNDVKLLAEAQSTAVRKPSEGAVTRMLRMPRSDQAGAEKDEWGGNLGFAIYEVGVLTGHCIWPPAFDREIEHPGWNPHQAKQQLRRLGHLHCEPNRATSYLPRRLSLMVEPEPGMSEARRLNPRWRVVVLRGFFK